MRPLLLLAILLCWFGTTAGFQPLVSRPCSLPLPSQHQKTVLYDFPSPFGGGGDDKPKPKLALPEIDMEGIVGKAIALVATVVAFVAIQKVGLMLAETYTPELSAQDIATYNALDDVVSSGAIVPEVPQEIVN